MESIDPVRYFVDIEHWLDGDIKLLVRDVGGDDASKLAVAESLRRIADELEAQVLDPSLANLH